MFPSVPVLGIFTKLDQRETRVMAALLRHDPSGPVPTNSWVKQKSAEFVRGLEIEFRKLPYPPASFISIGSEYILPSSNFDLVLKAASSRHAK